MHYDELDLRLLNLIQTDLPSSPEPFKAVAEDLQVGEAVVLDRLEKLIANRTIRRLGGIFDSRKLGYSGTLCALRVPEGQIGGVAEVVNSYPGVTHNYLREHPYNMWFTLLAPGEAANTRLVEEIKARTGITELLNLPAVRVFKVSVCFNWNEVQGVKGMGN